MTAPARLSRSDDVPAMSPVLVVDDSKAQRRLLTRTLEKWGYETLEAGSGEEALELCRATPFDIVISDWMMPGMSGAEFCRAFRASTDRPAFFVLLTAQTEREILAEGLDSGADDFLSKPFHALELRARLGAGQRAIQSQQALSAKNDVLTRTLDELSDAYAAIERDLKGARVFQEGLVPERYVSFAGADVSLLFRSSGHVGGDLVGYFPVRDGEIGVFSVDVSGHGVASALMTARIAGFLNAGSPDRNIALRKSGSGYEMIPLPEVCTRLNDILMMDTDSDLYLTMSIAHIDLDRRRVMLCQAGHPSPVIQRGKGDISLPDMWSTPIGLLDVGDFATTTLQFDAGDRFMLYSDGLTECPNPDDVLLDDNGLERIMRVHSARKGPEFVDALLSSLVDYRGNEDFPDDISAVVVEFR